MCIVAIQKTLQQWLHNTHKLDFLEKQCSAAMKNYIFQLHQIQNKNNPIKFLPSHSHLLPAYFYRWNLWRNIMVRAKPGQFKSDSPCMV